MDRYNFRRPSISRSVVNQSDSSDDESESEVLSDNHSDDGSIFDEADENFALEDVELAELNRLTEEDEERDENEQEEVVVAVPNRGQKYSGQGKNDKTVWWSMPEDSEINRTESLKQNRMNALAQCTRNFHEKHETFRHFIPSSIVEQIVLETNRKAKKVMQENRHEERSKKLRTWVETNADEMYAYIAILLYAGAGKESKIDRENFSNNRICHFSVQ